MQDKLYLSMHAVNQNGVGMTQFLTFEGLSAADAYVREWLAYSCGLTCLDADAQAAECAANAGTLPELSFPCPAIKSPPDLEGYNGFHYFAMGGAVSLFLMPIFDEASARKFVREVTQEYQLDKTFSDEADEMQAQLASFAQSFIEPIDARVAVEKIDELLKNDGLALF